MRLGSKAERDAFSEQFSQSIVIARIWAPAMFNLTLKKSIANRGFAQFHRKTLGKFCSRTSAVLLARYHASR